jgi:hypothetical protein
LKRLASPGRATALETASPFTSDAIATVMDGDVVSHGSAVWESRAKVTERKMKYRVPDSSQTTRILNENSEHSVE